tara:strand:+ start:12107 stop:12355 length:249 start_codon:yes stop_codon:yes gene_type:complete
MAWNRVQIDLGGESVDAMLSIDETQLEVANIIEVGDTIKVNKKTYKVLSSILNVQDNFLTLNLAKASKPKEKKSDDNKQVKG